MLELDDFQHILITRVPALTGRYEFAGRYEFVSFGIAHTIFPCFCAFDLIRHPRRQ